MSLLWTGGWDSTFQLLRLLLEFGLPVQPFYLIDADRDSTGLEILAMQRIRDWLFRRHPQTRQMIAPVRYFPVADIPADPTISGAFRAMRARRLLGDQYDWLARFCRWKSIAGIQLCVERETKPHKALQGFLKQTTADGQSLHVVDPSFSGTDEYAVFGHFSFPLFDLNKQESAAVVRDKGWQQVMSMTWFCHRPRNGVQPCGECNPCVNTIEDGLGWRVPLANRLRGQLRRRLMRLQRPLQKGPWSQQTSG